MSTRTIYTAVLTLALLTAPAAGYARTLTLEELPKMAITGTEQATIPEFDFDDDDEDEIPLARIGRPQGQAIKIL